jgi:hypothetical protein
VENQIFNHRHQFFLPLMANGRTNAEDSGPEGAPESFFAWRGPNSHRSTRLFWGAVCVMTGDKAAFLFELPKTTWLRLQILFEPFLYACRSLISTLAFIRLIVVHLLSD